MPHGIVSLKPLYDFLKANPDVAGFDGMSQVGRQYAATASRICESVAETQGFYLWGYYERNGLWRNIYLGKAGFGRTAHLRSRIREELKDERACIWRAFASESELQGAGSRAYGAMWQQYGPNMVRFLRKTGTTHIVWVSDSGLDNSPVQEIESDLIETLNPRANVSRPVPPHALQHHTMNPSDDPQAVLLRHCLQFPHRRSLDGNTIGGHVFGGP